MPETKKTTRLKSVKKDNNLEVSLEKSVSKKRHFRSLGLILLILLILIAFTLGLKFKGLVVVSTVNGNPIYSWDLAIRIYQNYLARSLDEIVNEKLIEDEASSLEISVSQEEVDSEIERVETEFDGRTKLMEELEKQFLSYDQFIYRVKLQLIIEKILKKKVAITDQEVAAYIQQNSLQMEATTEADLALEARQMLTSQKMNEIYSSLFSDLRKKAAIETYIKL
ncbi:MAG TPA: SurA N-terminal domain-containing protein [Candidatus Bathyarchaeia archaeon]|nr:SurA N-terminal domain-containing protein [Candidatus Bathyarchaeia archaeon]